MQILRRAARYRHLQSGHLKSESAILNFVAPNVIRIARNAGIIALFVIAGMLGILSGVLFAYAGDLPRISALDDYSPSTITRVYASNGQVVGEFATQRRVMVGYDDINPLLRQGIIATEDTEFDRHFGVNIWRIAVAGVIDILERRRAQGASTLTQQLARNLKDQFGLTSKSQSVASPIQSASPAANKGWSDRIEGELAEKWESSCRDSGDHKTAGRKIGSPHSGQTADSIL